MGDFFQQAGVPTLHHLSDSAENTAEWREWVGDRSVVLLLPALFRECGQPAFSDILHQVNDTSWVDRVVVSMNQLPAGQVEEARGFLARHVPSKKVDLVWAEDPDWQAAIRPEVGELQQGKGANVWMGLLWLLAQREQGWVLSHDADILNYRRELLWKLVLPLVHPEMRYRFSKAYYCRVAERLHGRMTRLLVFPLLQAMEDVLGARPMISHLQGFRYPLSGEFGADLETVGEFRLPSGWGLEVALLSELQRQVEIERFCQVDLGFHYEHRHRKMDNGVESDEGLVRPAREVSQTLFRQVMKESEVGSAAALVEVILPRYKARAEEWIQRYRHLSLMNGLVWDGDRERNSVRRFAEVIDRLRQETHTVLGPPLLRSPAEVLRARPELEGILQAIPTHVGS